MNFQQIEAFYWLTRLKSYGRVAGHVHRTQPAVSMRIATLENELGTKLIESTAPNFRLTEKGQEFAEFAEAFMNLRERMESRLSAVDTSSVEIGIVEPVMLTWGNTFAERLSSERFGFSITVGGNYELRQMVKEGAADIIFASGSMGVPVIADSFRVRYRMGWVARPDNFEPDGGPLSAVDIAGFPLIFYSRVASLASPPIEAISHVRASSQIAHTTTSLSTASEMVRRGYGAAPLVLAPFRDELKTGQIIELNVTDPLPPLEVRCVYINRSRITIARRILESAAGHAKAWCEANSDLAEFLSE